MIPVNTSRDARVAPLLRVRRAGSSLGEIRGMLDRALPTRRGTRYDRDYGAVGRKHFHSR